MAPVRPDQPDEGLGRVPTPQRMRRLFHRLEQMVRSKKIQGTYTRTNLSPDAPRDSRGYLIEPIPSATIRGGPIFRFVKEMRPDFPFNVVQINEFTSHRQCQWHTVRRNVGDSLFAMMGTCEGLSLIHI